MTDREVKQRLQRKARQLRKLSRLARQDHARMQWAVVEDELALIERQLAVMEGRASGD